MRYIVVLILLNIYSYANFCIAEAGMKIYQSSYSNSWTLSDRFIGFYKGRERSDRIQMQNNEGGVIGWIENIPNKIICAGNSGQSDYIDAIKVKNKRGVKTTLSQKALVVNSVNREDGTTKQIKIPYFKDSGLKRKKGEISLYEIYFILAEKVVNGQKVILLSKKSSLGYGDIGSLVGWVKAQGNLIKWDTRIAVEPEENRRFTAYITSRFNQKYGDLPNKKKKFYEMRYPLISKEQNGYKISFMDEEVKFGNIRQKVSDFLHQKDAKIIFVIDATAGMGIHINKVKSAIKGFLNGTNIKVAIAIYRDYPDGNQKYKLITKGWKSPKSALRKLDRVRAFSSSQDSSQVKGAQYAILKAVYNGIYSTLRDRRLDLKNQPIKTKMVVIGDYGNHTTGDSITQDMIVKLLTDYKVDITAIRIPQANYSQYSKLFTIQMKQIINQSKTGGEVIEIPMGNDIVSDVKKQIKNSVKRFQTTLRIVKKYVNYNGEELTKEEIKYLQDLGWDTDALGQRQQCYILYIKKDTPFKRVILADKKTINHLQSELQTMADNIRRWKAGDTRNRDSLIRSIKESIEVITGDKIKNDENIRDFINNKSMIPMKKGGFLDNTIEELFQEIEKNNKTRIDMADELEKKSIYLNALKEQVKVIDIVKKNGQWDAEYDVDEDDNRIKHRTLFDISISIDQRRNKKGKWLWVPLEYLP